MPSAFVNCSPVPLVTLIVPPKPIEPVEWLLTLTAAKLLAWVSVPPL